METREAFLATSGNQFQSAFIKDILERANIPYLIRDSALQVLGISNMPMDSQEFRVPQDRLQEAKDALCAGGYMCEVSERLLGRALKEIVEPLLQAPEPDLGRLRHFLEVNNKETSRALIKATLEKPGGRGLLEEIFFNLNKTDDLVSLHSLARELGPRASQEFFDRLKSVLAAAPLEARQSILEVLPDFPDCPERTALLASALLSPDPEVRDAAGEALFALGEGDFGYNAEAPQDQREEAVSRILESFK